MGWKPAPAIDAPAPNDTSFATAKAAGTPVAPVKPRQQADKAKEAKKVKKAEKVKEPSPKSRKGLGPRCGRRGRIVPSRHEGATSEKILPDGSVVRIS